jgi:hypothetical protein
MSNNAENYRIYYTFTASKITGIGPDRLFRLGYRQGSTTNNDGGRMLLKLIKHNINATLIAQNYIPEYLNCIAIKEGDWEEFEKKWNCSGFDLFCNDDNNK